MDELSEKYRKLNPFVQNSVGENVIWGSDDNGFCDVESINETPFKAVLSGLESVNGDGQTRALFLVGPAGSGKSHLFARLRRSLPHGQFTFVCNPPNAIAHIKRFILRKVVEGMTRPVMGHDGPLPYSQLQRMVYLLLRGFLKKKGLSVDQIHKQWNKLDPSQRLEIIAKLEERLLKIPGLTTLSDAVHVLVRTLDRTKSHLAASWLSGNQNLSEAHLNSLGLAGHLGDEEVVDLMKQLGKLSPGSGPIVLILDQLDSLVKPDQIREIESLMIDLNDSSRNWYIIVSLVHEKSDLWLSTLSAPFKGKFGIPSGDYVGVATAELSPLSNEQKKQLIMARLATPDLISQRTKDGVNDPCYPLSESAIDELACSDISNPRMLIQKAWQAYGAAVTGTEPISKITLTEFVEQAFADLRIGLQEEDLAVDTAYLADRVDELMRLLWTRKAGAALAVTDGSLHTELPNFEGIDRVYNCGGTPVRVILYDVQQKTKFPNVLKKIVNLPPNTILIRDGRIGISGKVTNEKLNHFQKDKKFCHLSLDQVKSLHALGKLLAKMREGEFDNDDTDPIPTEGAIYECLAQHPNLAETDLAYGFLSIAFPADAAKEVPTSQTEEKVREEPARLAPDDTLVLRVAKMMEQERWMSFERLCVRVNATGITADPSMVYQCLKNAPVSESVLIYPRNVNLLESMGIVVWNTEE
jgi:hypothetical protein